ncbi:MAG: response regulator [Lachnospiraceae bacterium]|nr:response regulator [Lachnospiraceae bacterium]
MIIIILMYNKAKFSMACVLMSIVISVCNAGYLALALSNNISEALLANKITYAGGIFLPFFMLINISELCHVKLPAFVKAISACWGIVTMYFVMMTGYNSYYYKWADIKSYKGVSYLVKEYGPMHNLYTIYIYTLALAALVVIVYSIIQKSKVSKRTIIALMCSWIVTTFSYSFERMLGLAVELVPAAYIYFITIALVLTNRSSMYDMTANVARVYEKTEQYGYIAFDKKLRYMSCNSVAIKLFPELENCTVDAEIKRPSDVLGHILNRIKNADTKNEYIEIHDRIIGASIKNINQNFTNHHVGYLVELNDETERQKYISQLSHTNEQLEWQIKQAEELSLEAQIANKAKSDFLASMSHEIRTPINAVIGMNTMILKDSSEDSIKEYARDIDHSAKILLHTINDILDFSKVESGKLSIVNDNYCFMDLINDCYRLTNVRAKSKNIELNIINDPSIPAKLFGDDTRIRQIMINLLTNAIKYTKDGSVTLIVKGEIKSDKCFLRVIVKDTGIGIREENIDKVFDSFKRVNEKNNKMIEGTGLGLYISKQIANLMGGDITVESEFGVGSTFTLSIAQAIVDNSPIGEFDPNNINNDDKEELSKTDVSTISGRVLVVDDVEMNLKVMLRFLRDTNITVDTSLSGQDAIDKASVNKYDLIFMDHMMPEMDGVEALKIMRSTSDFKSKDTPVIMLTANAITGAMEEYLEEGFDDYMSKPVKLNALMDMVKKYMLK